MAKTNYLNNKDLLREIHKSKISFCSFLDPSDSEYDLILSNLTKINESTIKTAKQNRADRLSKKALEEKQKESPRAKIDECTISPDDISNTDIVFRIMTFDHIPLAPGRKSSPNSNVDHHIKVNFAPFQHYKLNDNNEPYCVGKSHWVGGVKNGYFSKDHGKMTNELAKMFIKLCERYGTRGNWRNYSYNDEMRNQALFQLSQVALKFDESKSQNPFAYLTAIVNNSFTKVLNTEKRVQRIRDDILEANGFNPSHTRQSEWGSSREE